MNRRSILEAAAGTPRLDPVTRRLDQPTTRRATLDETVAVAKAQRGDEQAFAELVARYGQPILSICYASTLDAADAEDLAQDVFLAAWRGLRRFRGDSAFSTWLFALARNRCIDRSRRVAARPRLMYEREGDRELGTLTSPDDSGRRTAAAIFAAAAKLSLPLRQALLLRDVQGLSYEEIAELQAVPIGTVRSRIAAARAGVVAEVSE